jgi:hypothetical protein
MRCMNLRATSVCPWAEENLPILPQHIARVAWYRYQLGGGTDITVEQLMHCLARTKQRKQQAQVGSYKLRQFASLLLHYTLLHLVFPTQYCWIDRGERLCGVGPLSATSYNGPISVYRLGDMPILSCGQIVSARHGKRYTEIGLFMPE